MSRSAFSSRQADERRLALSRRQFLKGVGVCLSLPIFESALSGVLRAAPAAGGAATTATGAPLRMA